MTHDKESDFGVQFVGKPPGCCASAAPFWEAAEEPKSPRIESTDNAERALST